MTHSRTSRRKSSADSLRSHSFESRPTFQWDFNLTSLHPFSVLQALKRDVQNFTSSDLLQKVPFLRDQGTTNLQHTRAHIPIADTCTRARTHTHGKHLCCTHSKPHIHTLTITSSKTRGHAHTKHTFTASESLRKDLSAAFEIEVFVENTIIIEEDTVGELTTHT